MLAWECDDSAARVGAVFAGLQGMELNQPAAPGEGRGGLKKNRASHTAVDRVVKRSNP